MSKVHAIAPEPDYNFDFRPFGGMAVDPAKEAEHGVWIEVEGVRFLCLRAGGSNTRYKRAAESAYLSVRDQLRKDGKKEGDHGFQSDFSQAFHAAQKRVFAETIVLDWQGIRDAGTGKDIPFSQDAFLALLDGVPDLFDTLLDAAQERDRYMREWVEEAKDSLGKN